MLLLMKNLDKVRNTRDEIVERNNQSLRCYSVNDPRHYCCLYETIRSD